MIRRRKYIKRTPLSRHGHGSVRRLPRNGSARSVSRDRKPVKKRNPKRHASNWKRAYHSQERVEFVQALPCVVTGETPSVNAHTFTGGTSRKGDYTTIIPVTAAIHQLAHDQGWNVALAKCGKFPSVHRMRDFLRALAAETQAAWLAYADREGLPR